MLVSVDGRMTAGRRRHRLYCLLGARHPEEATDDKKAQPAMELIEIDAKQSS